MVATKCDQRPGNCDSRIYGDLQANVAQMYSKTSAATMARSTTAIAEDTTSDEHGYGARLLKFIFLFRSVLLTGTLF